MVLCLALSQLSALSQYELDVALSQLHLAALSQFAALSQLTLSYFVLDFDLEFVALGQLRSVQMVVRYFAVVTFLFEPRVDFGLWYDSRSVQLLKTFWIC